MGAGTASSGPEISIVIAVRNSAATLQRALDSVFEQTHPAELVVVDGASTDGTVEIIRRNDARIAYQRSEPDHGVYDAWNKALDHVTGEWILFLGGDDRLHAPDVLGQVAAALSVDAGAHRIAFGDIDRYRMNGTVSLRRYKPWDEARRRRFARGEMIPHTATFHHRSLFGRFDERFVIAGDYEFLLRELLDHDPLHIPVVVTDMGAGGLSERPSARYTLEREVYRARYLHGIVKTPPWRSRSLYRRLGRVWYDRHLRARVNAARTFASRSRPGTGAGT